MSSKGKAITIKFVSLAGTGYYYMGQKNPRTITRKLQFMKYDPVVNKHVLFRVSELRHWIN